MDPASATTPTDLIAQVRQASAAQHRAEVDVILLACAWADAHPDLDPVPPSPDDPDSAEFDPAVPAVDWRAGASFAAALGASTQAGDAMIRDALVLRHRLPQVWARVVDDTVPVWRARRVARVAHTRPDDVVKCLDEAVAPLAEKVGPVTLDRLLDEAMLRLYPEQREMAQLDALDACHVTLHPESINDSAVAEMTVRGDWKDLCDFDATVSEIAAALARLDAAADRHPVPVGVRRARAVGVLADPGQALALLKGATASTAPTAKTGRRRVELVVHLSEDAVRGLDPVGRVEGPGGTRAVLEQQVRDWCGRTDTQLTVTGVIDLTEHESVDRYEVRDRLRGRVVSGQPACVFPWCSRPGRHCDCDHVVPFAQGGSTCDCNLAPLCRRHHRLKTHGGWRYRTIETGVWLWSDPHRQQFLRDDRGTQDVTPLDDLGRQGYSGCRHRPPDLGTPVEAA